MGAKAGGTSLKQFSNECAGIDTKTTQDNFLNSPYLWKPFLTSTVHGPPIVASHLFNDTTLVDLMRHASPHVVFLYMMREETDRLVSAIQYVVKQRLCVPPSRWNYHKYFSVPYESFQVETNETSCKFAELPFVDELIEKQAAEIELSAPLGCSVWEEIDDTGPNIFFVDYRQADAIQNILGARYCPKVASRRVNEYAQKNKFRYIVKRIAGPGDDGVQELDLEEWLHQKRSMLEWTLRLRGSTCKRNLRTLQNTLQSCPVVRAL
jgi:hypothetical protein